MPKFRVTVYDRVVRHFEKDFEAATEEEAREQAEAESPETGWTERYEELFSEHYIASVEQVDEEIDEGV